MSIATEISRLQTAKSNLKTAIEAKGVLVGSGSIDTYPSKIGEITSGGGLGSAIYDIKMGTKTTITDADADWIIPLLTKSYGCQYLFANLSSITSVEITSSFAAAYYGMINAFANCSNITTVNLSGLTGVTAASANYAFNGCNKITYVNMANVVSGMGSNVNQSRNMFSSPLLETVHVHPHTFSANNTVNSPFYLTTNIKNVTLSAAVTDTFYIGWQPYLTSDSVLHILQKLSTSVTGKTCTFANITIQNTDTNYSAISALVSSLTNWTISGLTL